MSKINLKELFPSIISLIKNSIVCTRYSLRFVKKHTILLFLLVTIVGIIPFGTSAVLASVINKLTNIVQGSVSMSSVLPLVFLYALFQVLPSIVGQIKMYVDRIWFLKFQIYTELFMLKKQAETDIAHHEDPNYQNLKQKAYTNGLWPIIHMVDENFIFFSNFITVLIASVIAIKYDWRVFLIVLIVSIPKLFVDLRYGKTLWTIHSAESEKRRKYEEYRVHLMGKFHVIETKLFGNISFFINKLKDLQESFFDEQKKVETQRSILNIISDLIIFVGFVMVTYILVDSVLKGTVLIGTAIFIIQSVSRLESTISAALSTIARQYERNQYVSSLFELIETKPFIEKKSSYKKINIKEPPQIIFENVYFKYPRSKEFVLKNVSFTLNPREKVGLVGLNGAGKTTIVRLICRIHDPSKGRVLVNGTDLKEIDPEDWWNYLGVLFQDFVSYNLKAKEAIAISRSKEKINMTKVVESAELSQADLFINEWENKYDNQIGIQFGGAEPSKGQRQRLALARVIYRKAPLMILDEPTASVDIKSEAHIFETLEKKSPDQSILLISHDIAAIRKTDKILVLEDGEIKEQGRHDELIKKDGAYSKLFHLKAKNFQ